MKKIEILGMVLFVFFVTGCPGPPGQKKPNLTTLELKQEQWKLSNIKSYSMKFTSACECLSEEPKLISVNNAHIVDVKLTPSNTHLNITNRSDIKTIEGYFALIQDAYDRNAASVLVTYDERYGYPKDISIDYDTQVADEEVYYTLSEFRETTPMDENTVCLAVYEPICASVPVQCVTIPCNPIEQTFSNTCELGKNNLASYLYEGACV